MKRFTKLAVLFASILGLVGTVVPPAHADYVFDAAFTAVANLDGPLGYPGTPVGSTDLVPGVTTPLPTLECNLPLNVLGTTESLTNCHVDYHHNTRVVTAGSATCTQVGVATPDKSLASGVSDCLFAGSGTVSGYCGLSGGQIKNINYFNGHAFVTLDIHFDGVASLLVITGHWFKPSENPDQHGKVVGVVVAIPPLPTLTAGSCTNKTATTFQLVGTATGVSDLVL